MPISRRDLGLAATATATAIAAGADAQAAPKETVAMLVYPGFTALDLIGPHHFMKAMIGARVELVAKTLDPVTTDTGVRIIPSATFADIPDTVDVIFVPGGTRGTLAAMQDAETVAFLADRGSRARYVTSVCTGSLVLGAAGLLAGRRATSHWMTVDVLPTFGAIPVRERVVTDGNRITGAGVTAGLDYGLTVLADLRGEDYAKLVQLMAEYDPHPPFQSGRPDTAPEQAKVLNGMYDSFRSEALATAQRVQSARAG